MSTAARGTKHTCPECARKYYDLNKEVVTCPQCGAKPPPVKVSRLAPVRRTGNMTIRSH